MKKILALVLALVMTLSLATISSGAAYSDADKVQYVDAVNTMSALGVMGGYADGSIRPAADVTRGAAAKMVSLVATGSNKTVIGYYAGTSSFADVPAGHTFADVVAYCVGKGIVDGYGDGTFGVGDNVKGWAVAKMCLVAMGYNAEAFGLTGSGAALRTIELATEVGLFDDLKADFVATAPASREECAQIIYNALFIEGVKVTETSTAGTVTYGPSGACLADKYDDYVGYGMIVANAATGAAATMVGEVALTNASGLDMIGHYVMYCVDPSVAEVDGAATAYALVDLSSAIVVADGEKELTAKEVKALFGAEELAADDAVYFADYAVADEAAPAVAAGDVVDGTYVLVDGEIVAYLAPATFEVTYVSEYEAGDAEEDGVLTLANGDEWDIFTATADAYTMVSYYAEIAEGDAVAVQATGDLYTVSKLETVTGNLSEITADGIVVGGKTYYASEQYGADIGVDAIDPEDALLTDVVLYLDITGAVVAITAVPDAEVEAKTSVVYVAGYYAIPYDATYNAYGQEITPAGENLYAQVVDMNGKEASLLVYEEGLSGLAVAVENYDSENKVTYYTFIAEEELEEDAVSTWEIGAASDATALKAANGYYYASDVKYIFVSVDEDDMSKLSVEIKTSDVTVEDGTAFYATRVGETANFSVKYVVIAGEYQAPVVANDDIVLVAFDSDYSAVKAVKDAEGNVVKVYAHNVYVNGVAKDITVDNEATIDAGFYSYTIDENGCYDLVELGEDDANIYAGEVTNVFGTLLTVGDMADIEAKNAKIVDAEYAAMDAAAKAEAKEIKAVADLAGAYVAVVYDVDATGAASSFVTIYVIARAEAE